MVDLVPLSFSNVDVLVRLDSNFLFWDKLEKDKSGFSNGLDYRSLSMRRCRVKWIAVWQVIEHYCHLFLRWSALVYLVVLCLLLFHRAPYSWYSATVSMIFLRLSLLIVTVYA